MEVQLSNIEKRFNKQLLYSQVDLHLKSGDKIALLGPNGSGKSTLLQIMAGQMFPSKGEITWRLEGKEVKEDNYYRHYTFASPYQRLFEDLNLSEMLEWHYKLKMPYTGFNPKQLAEKWLLAEQWNKPIKQFSSGMKQRLKLGLALFSQSEIVFLDEPCTNLDQQGIDLYKDWVKETTQNRTLLVAGNRVEEYDICPVKFQIHPELKTLKQITL